MLLGLASHPYSTSVSLFTAASLFFPSPVLWEPVSNSGDDRLWHNCNDSWKKSAGRFWLPQSVIVLVFFVFLVFFYAFGSYEIDEDVAQILNNHGEGLVCSSNSKWTYSVLCSVPMCRLNLSRNRVARERQHEHHTIMCFF